VEADKLLADERMTWQKVIVGNDNIEINRCDIWDGDRRGCWAFS
jgi:hypothetical protein